MLRMGDTGPDWYRKLVSPLIASGDDYRMLKGMEKMWNIRARNVRRLLKRRVPDSNRYGIILARRNSSRTNGEWLSGSQQQQSLTRLRPIAFSRPQVHRRFTFRHETCALSSCRRFPAGRFANGKERRSIGPGKHHRHRTRRWAGAIRQRDRLMSCSRVIFLFIPGAWNASSATSVCARNPVTSTADG
jgi:hypothetical protein